MVHHFKQQFLVGGGWWWIFWYKICLEAEKMWKNCRKITFLECYQTLKIVFWTIFHCTPKCLDFNFLTGIHFPLHSFYTRNSIYIEPNTAFVSILFLFWFCFCFWVVWVSFGFVYLDQYLLVRLGLWKGNVVEVFNFFGVIYEV